MSELKDLLLKLQHTGEGDTIEMPFELWQELSNACFHPRHKYLTHDEIMKDLELKPWSEFAKNQIVKNMDQERTAILGQKLASREKHRQTGRSTRMMVSALVVMAQGFSVRIYGLGSVKTQGSHTLDLIRRLREYSKVLGINPYLAKTGGYADLEFFDHTYWEVL